MIKFDVKNELLVLSYQADQGHAWPIDEFKRDKNYIVTLKKTFSFVKEDLYLLHNENLSDFDLDNPVEFILGRLKGEYFQIQGKILGINNSVFIHQEVLISNKFFTATRNISIFQKISKLVPEDIYIGGNRANSIPYLDFMRLIKGFPNTYEIDRYANARLSVVLRDYFESVVDYEKKYNRYMNKKISIKVSFRQACMKSLQGVC